MSWATAIQLLTAVGLGTVISQVLTSSRDTRTARATALGALGEVESTRWADTPRTEFEVAVRQMRTAALLARLPREPVEDYILVAMVARQCAEHSIDRWGHAPDDTTGAGFIDTRLSAACAAASILVADLIWTPRWQRPIRRHRRAVKGLSKAIEEGKADDDTRRFFEYLSERRLQRGGS